MKKTTIVVAAASLLVGFSGGFAFAYIIPGAKDGSPAHQTDSSHSHSSATHQHETIEMPKEQAPSVKLHVEEDTKSGWYIRLETTNFTFTPENANKENVLGEGHAHLYVDGKLVSRIYGHHFHYRENLEGSHVFKVTLNGNNHADYVVEGKVVGDEITVF